MDTILISGASIAGPAMAFWLTRLGYDVTVVERAPALRRGGYAVDFRGPATRSVLERMGLLDELRSVQTGGSPMRFIAADGRLLLRLPGEFAGGELEVLRADLSRVLVKHSNAEYVFGDSITALSQTDGGVDVSFERGTARRFDLVIGADGLHSHVRRLAFGEGHVKYLGYYVASWELPPSLREDGEGLYYNEPGRMISASQDAFAVFASPPLSYGRHDIEAQKSLVRKALAGMGWRAQELLRSLDGVDDMYFDSISRVDVEPWSRGRVVLLGDAANGATLGGMGTGTAILGAYVLAGELSRSGGDYATAFARYEATIADFARRCQKGGDRAGKFLAPKTRAGAFLRNRMLSNRYLLAMMLKAGEDVSSGLDLPDYGLTA